VDPRAFFTEDDCRAIAEAAEGAEGRTSGEVVPYVVGSCDEYSETWWKATVLGALVGGLGGIAVHNIAGVWGGSIWSWVILPAVVLAVAGALAARWFNPVRRLLVPDQILDHRARQRAEMAFLEEEVFSTRDRSGILIFLALFEHRVVVLGDSGINRAVPEGAWQHVVDDLVAGIRARRPAEALVEAIHECGRLLEAHRLEIRPDDVDELPNELRIRER
jgi:putative membrane protein